MICLGECIFSEAYRITVVTLFQLESDSFYAICKSLLGSQSCCVLGISNIGAKCDFEIWGFKGFSVFGQEKKPLKWLLDDQTLISKLETIHRRFATRNKVPSSASVGLKK